MDRIFRCVFYIVLELLVFLVHSCPLLEDSEEVYPLSLKSVTVFKALNKIGEIHSFSKRIGERVHLAKNRMSSKESVRIKEENDKGHFHIATQNMHLPGGTGVKNLPGNAGGACLIHGWGTKIPHISWCSQNFFFNSIVKCLMESYFPLGSLSIRHLFM